MTEQGLFGLLRLRYPPQEYALLGQVANGTGSNARRHADAVVMSLWPSRGLHLSGFEIKSHRGDWLREKDDPGKAEVVASYCDYWWIVAPNEKVVPVTDLPVPWGLMIPVEKAGATQLRIVKPAERFPEPKPMTRNFLAAILRRTAAASVPVADLERAAGELAAGKIADIEQRFKLTGEANARRADELQKLIDEFEVSSGVSIRSGWNGPGRIGAAVKLMVDLHRQSGHGLAAFRSAHQATGEAVAALEAVQALSAEAEKEAVGA